MATPRPHTRNEWLSLPKGKQGFASYDRYRNWWQGRVAPKFQQAGQPLSTDYLSAIPMNQLQSNASSTIQQTLAPLIKRMTDAFTQRSRSGSAAIGEYTKDWANMQTGLPERIGGFYDQAIQGSQNVSQGLANFATQQGQALGGDIGAKMAGINAPPETAAATSGVVAGQGAGAGLAAMGYGSATQDQLLTSKAGEQTYGAKLPGVIGGFGFNKLRDFQQGLNTDMRDQLGDINAKIPGMVSDLYQSLYQREVEKAIARRGFDMDTAKANAAANAPAGFDSGRSNFMGYAFDDDGNPILDASGNPIPKYEPPDKGGGGGKGQARLDQARRQARSQATDLYKNFRKLYDDPVKWGVIKGQGQGSKKLTEYRTAATRAVLGILDSYFPGMSIEAKYREAANILRGAGWDQPAKALEGRGGILPVQGGRVPARPAAAPQRPGGAAPRATPKPPPVRGERYNEGFKPDKKREAEMGRSAQGLAEFHRDKKLRRDRAITKVFQALRREYQGYPDRILRQIATNRVNKVYGNFLYGK